MLEVHELRVRYGPIEAVRGISFSVGRGQIVSLIGRNGAGKTTTLNAVSGLLPITAGRVVLDGREIQGSQPHQIVDFGVVQVPEGRRVFPRMTVWENLAVGAFTRPRDPGVQEDLERVYDLFPDLKGRQNQLAGTLSGGEQQMLAIGRAMMARPRLLMLDEPSMGLAPLLARNILATLQVINQAGTSILLVEQNVKAALELASQAYVLETGEVVLSGEGLALLKNVQVRKAYLGED